MENMMCRSKEPAEAHFSLVSAAQDFVIRVVPLSGSASESALAAFVHDVTESHLSLPQIDAILLRCLSALDRHSGGWRPTLVERYLGGDLLSDAVGRFERCVRDLVRYRGVRDRMVAQAIGLIERRYPASDVRSTLAEDLGVPPAMLSARFRRATGYTLTEYIRAVRLSHAAILLVGTNQRVKDIWVAVGFNDNSNFNHEFKEHFGVSPTDYRARGVVPAPSEKERLASPPTRLRSYISSRVLVIDDDVYGTEIVSRYLRLKGHVVVGRSSAESALRIIGGFRPHVVLLDHRLGTGADGIECLRRLRCQSFVPQPAVAVITGDWGIHERANELRELNATLVFKPCDLDDLHEIVTRLTLPS